MNRIEHYFIIAWPVISPIIAFFTGAAYTRWILTDRYCPSCLLQKQWVREQKAEVKKAEKNK